jgi:hypothetical protein
LDELRQDAVGTEEGRVRNADRVVLRILLLLHLDVVQLELLFFFCVRVDFVGVETVSSYASSSCSGVCS